MEKTYLPGTVRERIQDQLKERKITQGELAVAIGISESALSRFLSAKTDKIGDDYIIKIADFLDVSTDFILGQTDFPERRNYNIEELGLSYKAAMVLYTGEVNTDVVNRMLEHPKFPAITRMIARYFEDTVVEGLIAHNAMLDKFWQLISAGDTSYLAKPQEGVEAATQIIEVLTPSPHERDIEMIQAALMDMLRDIKAGIQTRTPTTELATTQLTEAMMETLAKGGSAQPLLPQIALDQIIELYSSLPGGTPELGEAFAELFMNFFRDCIILLRKQGLIDGPPMNGILDK